MLLVVALDNTNLAILWVRERETENLKVVLPRLPLTVNCTRRKVHENWKLEAGKLQKKNQHARKVHKKNIESRRVAFHNWQRHQLSMGTLSLWVFAWNLYELINFANGSSLGSSTFAYLPEIFPAIFPVPKMRFFFLCVWQLLSQLPYIKLRRSDKWLNISISQWHRKRDGESGRETLRWCCAIAVQLNVKFLCRATRNLRWQ